MKSPKQHRYSLVWRIIFYFALASITLSLVVNLSIFLWNYQQQTHAFNERLEAIRGGYTESLASGLWFYDKTQISSQIKGIMNLDGVIYARVTDEHNLNIESGSRPHYRDIEIIDLFFNGRPLGKLEIAFDRGAIFGRASKAAIASMIVQLGSLLLLASVLALIVYRLINSRIRHVLQDINDRLTNDSFVPLSIRESAAHDEIDQLVHAFNTLSKKINDELKQKKQAQQQLKIINTELENRVAKRTQNLQHTVDELNKTLKELHDTQGQLIEAEKLSSLGGMVAGVSHEINTPLGLCITIHSYMADHYQQVRGHFVIGQAKKQEQEEFANMMDESLSVLDKNLQRAAHLIKSFKQVSVDQAGEHVRDFYLQQYLNEILETLSPEFKQTQHQIDIDCSDQLHMSTYPGAIAQIFTNLIINSLIHGFENKNKGIIRIIVAEEKGNVVIEYSDNGIGLSKEAEHRIFEPFYTTKRGQGGTGLGMHLVYNLMHQRLKGEIHLESGNHKGVVFRLIIPKKLEDKND